MICDLAETYGIYDYGSLPPMRLAALVAGLRDDSRIRQKECGLTVSKQNVLLAVIADLIGAFVGKEEATWVSWLTGEDERRKASAVTAFDSAEEFEKMRQKIMRGE